MDHFFTMVKASINYSISSSNFKFIQEIWVLFYCFQNKPTLRMKRMIQKVKNNKYFVFIKSYCFNCICNCSKDQWSLTSVPLSHFLSMICLILPCEITANFLFDFLLHNMFIQHSCWSTISVTKIFNLLAYTAYSIFQNFTFNFLDMLSSRDIPSNCFIWNPKYIIFIL